MEIQPLPRETRVPFSTRLLSSQYVPGIVTLDTLLGRDDLFSSTGSPGYFRLPRVIILWASLLAAIRKRPLSPPLFLTKIDRIVRQMTIGMASSMFFVFFSSKPTYPPFRYRVLSV